MRLLRLDLAEPPSTNRYYRQAKGRIYLSAEAKAYRLTVHAAYVRAFKTMKIAFPTGPVTLRLQWYRARKSGDLSNRLKQVEDALQGLAYANDSQVVRIAMQRYDDPVVKGRLIVEIEQ